MPGRDDPPKNGWDRRREAQLRRYETVALQLFAERGYHAVTVDDIAEAAGASARTLFRYFPSKEDFLLGEPRRGLVEYVARVNALQPVRDPFPAAWGLVRQEFLEQPYDVASMNLWRSAASNAPEVHARVRGDYQQTLLDAFTAFGVRCLGSGGDAELRARLVAGVMVGMEMAMVETLGRSDLSREQIVEITEALLTPASGTALLDSARARRTA